MKEIYECQGQNVLPHQVFHSATVFFMTYEKYKGNAEAASSCDSGLRLLAMVDLKSFGEIEYNIKKAEFLKDIEMYDIFNAQRKDAIGISNENQNPNGDNTMWDTLSHDAEINNGAGAEPTNK